MKNVSFVLALVLASVGVGCDSDGGGGGGAAGDGASNAKSGSFGASGADSEEKLKDISSSSAEMACEQARTYLANSIAKFNTQDLLLTGCAISAWEDSEGDVAACEQTFNFCKMIFENNMGGGMEVPDDMEGPENPLEDEDCADLAASLAMCEGDVTLGDFEQCITESGKLLAGFTAVTSCQQLKDNPDLAKMFSDSEEVQEPEACAKLEMACPDM